MIVILQRACSRKKVKIWESYIKWLKIQDEALEGG